MFRWSEEAEPALSTQSWCPWIKDSPAVLPNTASFRLQGSSTTLTVSDSSCQWWLRSQYRLYWPFDHAHSWLSDFGWLFSICRQSFRELTSDMRQVAIYLKQSRHPKWQYCLSCSNWPPSPHPGIACHWCRYSGQPIRLDSASFCPAVLLRNLAPLPLMCRSWVQRTQTLCPRCRSAQ